MTFCDWFAGATQVKWNRQDSHILASSHDKYLRIWDERKGAYPLRSIEAHDTKIYGVDWNRTRSTGIVTCSLDKTIKFWDYANFQDQPERVIRTCFPVWRARHTPFGWGLLAMPQRGNHDLHLYDRRLGEGHDGYVAIPPVRKFEGHQDQVKEFLWRPRGGIIDGIDNREFQLVSWGTDRDLRLHHLDEKALEDIGHVKGEEVRKKLNLTRKDAVYKTFRDEPVKAEQNSQRRATSVALPGHDTGLVNHSSGALSAGMRKAPIPSARGWGDGGFMSSVSGMRGRSSARKEVNPITWMRGVKVGHSNMHDTRLSALSPGFRPFDTSDPLESLGDEITHVGEKFSKVSFEAVDVPARHTIISMNGPWGVSGISVFVKADIVFPSDYPEISMPTLKIEKTSSISEETLRIIMTAVDIIARSYSSRKKGSLEAILRYLLGERSLEDSTVWPIDDQEPASSSDEDDDEVGTFAGIQSQDLEMSDSGLLGPSNANANVPLPKACGALWADNGRLVCFFPPKEEQNRSLLGTLTSKDGDRYSRSQKIFEGFGQFQTSSPGPKTKTSTIDTTDGTIHDGSEDSFTSSSSSSGSSDVDGTFGDGFRPSLGWRGAALGLQRSRSTDQSQRSSAAPSASKLLKPKNVVSIHSLEDLLPAKKLLANEYAIFGNGPDVCSHNAKVAAEQGNQDLAAVWAFIRLILHNEVPLKVMLQPYRKEPVLVLARHALSNVMRRDSAVDLSYDETNDQGGKRSTTGRVRWGQHPFGGSWLIEALFKHFEKAADVQMLAMMSCIFCEPRATEGVSRALVHGAPHLTRPQSTTRRVPEPLQLSSIPVKSPAFSLDYFPSEEVAWSLHQPNGSVRPTSRTSRTPLGTSGSAGSSNGVWSSDPLTPYSTGTTPPFSHRFSRMSIERPGSQVQNISTSPERRYSRRSNSNLASAFTASLPPPFSLAPSISSSPPTTFSRKGLSPAQSFVGVPPANAVTWGVTSIFGTGTSKETSPPVYPASESDTELDIGPSKNVTVKIKLKNQNLFDMEGYASVPLLVPSQEWWYRAYRDAYAHMLDVWGLPLKRCEVLKFNGLTSYFSSFSPAGGQGTDLLPLGKKRIEAAAADVWLGLGVRGNCSSCGGLLHQSKEGSSARKKCDMCATEQKQNVPCSACGEVVRTLYTPCFQCGHITHTSCHRTWFALVESDEWECLTGCGCRCAEYEFVDVEMPVQEDQSRPLDLSVDQVAEADLHEGWESLGFQSMGRVKR
ncbi:MAG: hypothetical protein M1830_003123 [Pleopsidium flavum]|nr:MAG: hypothetical protein M1830_008082 [Pleopsidium flavum]KAI9877681.1 MAG: hypothetical protein M1830_003123 [Pleopsidium flavum]